MALIFLFDDEEWNRIQFQSEALKLREVQASGTNLYISKADKGKQKQRKKNMKAWTWG